MSILDNNTNIVPLELIMANQLVHQTKSLFNDMVTSFNNGAKNFWQNSRGISPAQIAQALGTNAKEVFELHYALGQLINAIKPEAIAEGWSVIGQFTMNEDGTVTIVEPETSQDPNE